MIHSITIHYKGAVANDGSFSRAAWLRLIQYAWEQVGRKWHLEMRPKHFTKEGAKEYFYEPRQGESQGTGGKKFWSSYTGQKKRKFGHTLPLVWTGETRDMSRTANITATSRGVRIKYSLPMHVNFTPKGHRHPMVQEFLAVSDRERTELGDLFQITLNRLLRNFHGSSSRRIR
jgi:hypothetical protein